MIIYKASRNKRIKPFKVSADDEVENDTSLTEIEKIDWKHKPASKIQTSNASDAVSNCISYGCYNSGSSDKNETSDGKELLIPGKRKVSCYSMDNGVYPSISAKKQRFSEDEDGENDGIEDSPSLFQDIDNEVKRGDVRLSSTEGGQRTSFHQHFLSQIPPTEKKKYPQRRCVYCRMNSAPRDTRYYCKTCINTPALCKEPCFRKYHSM